MEFIFGDEKELIKEYKLLINEVLPSLKGCKFCGKLKCKYCERYSVNCSSCQKDKCFNCVQFNKSKDILINTNKIFSDYIKKILFDFFSISRLSNAFCNINFYTDNSKNATVVQYFSQSLQTVTITKKNKKFFYYKSKKFKHYCKI